MGNYRNKYNWDQDRVENMYNRWMYLVKQGKPTEWKNFEEFLRWCKATYEPGTSLHRIDEVKPYCPTNCEWKPMTNSVQYRKHLADKWDRIMVPIRQRYEKQIREVQEKKAQQYFRYEHPDLVREGIVWGT